MPRANRKVWSRLSTGRRIVMCLTMVRFHRNCMKNVMMTTNRAKTIRV